MIEYSIIGVGFIMVKYPRPLQEGDTIGITAPSSGVTGLFAQKLEYAKKQLKKLGFNFIETESVKIVYLDFKA